MILYIDTTPNDLIEIGLKDGNKLIYKMKLSSRRTQAEKLLPAIAKFLSAHKLKLSDLRGVEVVNRGGSFTSLRIGVVTANALGYALSIPVREEGGEIKQVKSGKLKSDPVRPEYGSEPDITVKLKKI